MTGDGDVSRLGRVFEPADLERHRGAGRLRVDVPAAWLRDGATVEIIVPDRLICADCDGGGCDACQRSGAFRLGLDEPTRTVPLTLPRNAPAPSIIRLVRPFGPDAVIEQLLVEVRRGAAASPFCHRVARAGSRPSLRSVLIVGLVLLAAAVLLAVLLGARAH